MDEYEVRIYIYGSLERVIACKNKKEARAAWMKNDNAQCGPVLAVNGKEVRRCETEKILGLTKLRKPIVLRGK